ncbi:SWIM zinc finger family protein, partial [Streptomyces sp. T-3]|nr:SWIM zinc finger family protein [Streptomyces sp. T-3]
ETARRMVDAQAPGLAARVRELGAIPGSGPGWPVRLLEECALTHLLDQAWLRRELLPETLAATVRSRVGLPASADGSPLRDEWLVLAQYDTAEAKLTTRRIWLYGTRSRSTALVLSFGAAGRAPEVALPVGLVLDAELSAYPGSGPRAALGERFSAPTPSAFRPVGVDVRSAAVAYGSALRDDPWAESCPVMLDRVIPSPGGEAWQLVDADSDVALPVAPAALGRGGLWKLAALSGGEPVSVFGEFGHLGFSPLAAWARGAGEVVPLC